MLKMVLGEKLKKEVVKFHVKRKHLDRINHS
jgi:hypothetical protein